MSRHLDKLKPLAQLTQADDRQSGFTRYDPAIGNWRPLTVEDMYSNAASISLHVGVPEQVREHFATALNLLAYSWFYYPFNVTAQFLGYVAVEYALRERFPEKRGAPFSKLVSHAVTVGLIRDSGFSHVMQPAERQAPPFLQPPASYEDDKSYSEALIKILPSLRNILAHGSNMLHMHGAGSVRVCAEFINQLFERPSDA